eukprot:scaffold37242_cov131-Skeletonema_marinoi.AAC.1
MTTKQQSLSTSGLFHLQNFTSLYMKRLWRMSWQHTSIWSWERRNNQLNTSYLRTRARSDLHPEIPTLQFRSRLIDMIKRDDAATLM